MHIVDYNRNFLKILVKMVYTVFAAVHSEP